MRHSGRLVAALLSTSILATACCAETPTVQAVTHPVVAGYERFVNVQSIDDVQRGLLLLNELGCVGCHGASKSDWEVAPKSAPVLSNVGKQVQATYFEKYLLAPREIRPGTTMPDLLANLPPEKRAKVANEIAHFLASTGKTQHQPATAKEIARGDKLFHTVGCVACHDPQRPDAKNANGEAVHYSTSVPLGRLSEKYTIGGLTRFLRDPLHSRPSGRMPKFDLSDEEFRNIATWLLRDLKFEADINYAYYEGAWERLPKFDQLTPKQTGTATSMGVNKFAKTDGFGVVFSGFWETNESAEYKFRLSSDDGSKLLIDGQLIVDNDGLHGAQFKSGKARFDAGLHEVRIEFFEMAGGESLECTIESEEMGRLPISSLLRSQRKLPAEAAGDTLVVDPEKAAAGKKHFESVGCANCHEMNNAGSKFDFASRELAELDPSSGCLSETSDNQSVRFGLSPKQRQSIRAAMKFMAKGMATEPKDPVAAANIRVHQRMMTLNCYTCHSRETGTPDDFKITGGVVDALGESQEIFGRDKWFTGTEGEMGDEGRLPPNLQVVGAKLNREWLGKVLKGGPGTKVRPYVKTMMPVFGNEHADALVEDFTAADKLPRVVEVNQTAPENELKKHGKFLAGEKALSCIKCHTFSKYPSLGLPALSLTTMTERLNKSWFQLYMINPSALRRGTRMPQSWPGGDTTFYPDMLDGDVDKQIDAVWNYLSDGEEASRPQGLLIAKQEIVARDIPRIYRNFIEGAGSRAIGVGYPERVNIAFDANLCRLAIIWKENFIDASRHWTGRGIGFEGPLGENVLKLGDGSGDFSFDAKRWPKIKDKESARTYGLRFDGYSLNDKRQPTFLYRLSDTRIEDRPTPVSTGDEAQDKSLTRTFTVTGNRDIFYRIATGKIEHLGKGIYSIDDKWKTQITGDVQPSVDDTSDTTTTLYLKIPARKEPVTFQQKYLW